MELTRILKEAAARNASDILLYPGGSPMLRIQGELVALDGWPALDADELDRVGETLMSPVQRRRFLKKGAVDVSYVVPDLGRFRTSISKARGKASIAIRAVPHAVRDIEELGLPPVVARLALEPRGLILVTGPAGAGKTTTMSAMIRHMNTQRRHHIVTIEDPIEYLHQNDRCVITQREIGSDTPSFKDALRVCFRQNPDVIMVGEIRDLETVNTVLILAETGHLVLSTVHTLTAVETVNRIISIFPAYHERQVRRQLSQVLCGIISQRLMRRADGSGLVPAVEVLVNTTTIAHCIEDPSRTSMIPSFIEQGREVYGMQTFDQCVLQCYERGLVTLEEALRNATNPANVEVAAQEILISHAAARRTAPERRAGLRT
jgi:twitching motility protein PilT